MMPPATDNHESNVEHVIEALGQRYVLEILDATSKHALSARDIAREAEVPTTTLYRRLDTLVDEGLLKESMKLDGHGDHHHLYESQLDNLIVTFDDNGIDIDLNLMAEINPVKQPTPTISAD